MIIPGADFSAKEKIDHQKAKPREIHHENTRYMAKPFDLAKSRVTIAQAAETAAQSLHGKIGVDGKEMLPGTSPKVNGYGFVGTPSPAPGMYLVLLAGFCLSLHACAEQIC